VVWWSSFKLCRKNCGAEPGRTAEPFQGLMALLIVNPGFSLRSNPGLKLANALGVKIQTKTLPLEAVA
jgi:hypothetical protein